MKEYAIINWEKKVVDIIQVENTNTLDGYILPEGEVIAFPTYKVAYPIQIGMTYEPSTEMFI
jgi:hypothetical protein